MTHRVVVDRTEDKDLVQVAFRTLRFGKSFRLHKPIKTAKIGADGGGKVVWVEVDSDDFERALSLLKSDGIV